MNAWITWARQASTGLAILVCCSVFLGYEREEPPRDSRLAGDVHVAESQPTQPRHGATIPDASVPQHIDMPKAEPAKETYAPRTIVAMGDSLTAGFGVSPHETYPAQLQRRLDALGYRYRILNAGVSGDTTAGGLRRLSWVLNGHPDVVILELGGNDGLRGFDLNETRANLEAIILRLKEAGVLTVLAGMKLPPNYGADYTSRFESMYRDLASRHNLPLIPFFLHGVGGEQRLNQSDGIHPTGEGYRIVVDNVLKTLQPLLERRISH